MASLRHFSYTFSANESILISALGSSIRCTEGVEVFSVAPDRGSRIQLQEGIGFELPDIFKRWEIINGSNPQTITIYIGDGEILDSRQYGEIDATIVAGSDLNNPSDFTINSGATDTIAANASRRSLMIQASINNTDNLRVGNTGEVGANRGIEVTPGASYPVNVTTAVDVYSPANGQIYRYWEIS